MRSRQSIMKYVASRLWVNTAKPGKKVYHNPHPESPLFHEINAMKWVLDNYTEHRIMQRLDALNDNEEDNKWYSYKTCTVKALEDILYWGMEKSNKDE